MKPRTTPLRSGGRRPKPRDTQDVAEAKWVLSRPKRRKRPASEFARIYGSKKRVEFVKGLRCLVAGKERLCYGPSENAHIETGGMSRKADYDRIVPLCAAHHGLLHRQGARWFQTHYGVSLVEAAATTQRLWEAHQA